jgi:uncharacterized protein
MMVRKTMLIGFALLALVTETVTAAPPAPMSHTAMVKTVIEQHIIPHIDAMKAAFAPLPDAVGALCKSGSPQDAKALDDRFRRAVIAYAGVDHLRFGPMQQNGRREQISFWPDPRGFVARQMRLLLLNKDDGIAKPGALAKQSAALQGLPALENLMRSADVPLGPAEAAHYRCVVAEAIANNLVRLADEVSDGWEKSGGWADKMLHPGPANDTYKNESEPAVEVVKALIVGLSLVGDVQMKPQVDNAMRLSPPYDKSGLRKDFYAANVASLRQLYNTLDLESYLQPNMLWIKDWVAGTWRTLESSDGAGGRAPHAPREDAPTPREVFDRTNMLRNMVANRLSVAAKLTVGFNELDGD